MVKKKNNWLVRLWKKSGLGLRLSIFYLVVTIVTCAISFALKNIILELSFFKLLQQSIDKTAVLSIVTAIAICVITTLTLSLSIEGNIKNSKYGMTPKQLNEYLGFPISLNCSFIAVSIYFLASVVLLKSGNGFVFFVLSFLTTIYYLIIVLKGLPVLSGNDKRAFIRIALTINGSNESEMANVNSIIKYLYSKGQTIGSVFDSITEKSIINDKIELRKILLNALTSYVADELTPSRDIRIHRKFLCSLLYDFFRIDDESPYIKCKAELFVCLNAMRRKDNSNKDVYEVIYETAFHFGDSIKNKENALLIEYLFARFVTDSLQTGDLSFFDQIKKNICEFEISAPFSESGQLNFFILSFLLFKYYYDKKVPESIKKSIDDLKSCLGRESRFDDQLWGKVLLNVVNNNRFIKRDAFLRFISTYADWLEYTVFGKVYTPVITEETALEWYWSYLCLADKANSIDAFIDTDNVTQNYCFERFINDIDNGNTMKYIEMLTFFLPTSVSNCFARFDVQLKKEITEYFNSRKIDEVNHEIESNDIEIDRLVGECKEYLNKNLNKEYLSGKQLHKKKVKITSFQRYDRCFEPKLNYGCVAHNIGIQLENSILKTINVPTISTKSNTLATLIPQIVRKKNIFVNNKFVEYIDCGILSSDCKAISNKATLFESPLYYYPTCFITNLPFVGNVNVEIKTSAFTEKDYEMIKNECDNGSGIYILKGIRYNEKDLLRAIDSVYIKLEIIISYEYSLNNSKGFSVDPFN